MSSKPPTNPLKEDSTDNERNQARIKRIRVDRLFGLYTYDLQSPRSGEGPGLMLLYGDNGSGKTTILKLVLHLLASEHGSGHKTFIAHTPFNRLEVELENKVVVTAARPKGHINGSFSIILSIDGKTNHKHHFRVQQNKITQDSASEEAGYRELLRKLRRIGLQLYYIGDDRRIETSHSDPILDTGAQISLFDGDEVDFGVHEPRIVAMHRRIHHQEHSNKQLEHAISQAVQWITNHAIKASDTGTLQVNTIYSDVLHRITNHGGDAAEASTQTLYRRITKLAQANTDYSNLGLTAAFEPNELLTAIERARPQNRALINSVLEPYIAGLEARLEALKEVKNILSKFINNIHGFYSNKRISFTLGNGFRITSTSGDSLEPSMLSSGERQLLLLLCSALGARDRASIFIIDEPEISLNIKWQRMLVRALLDCMEGAKSQLLLATHSIELLAQHKKYISKLENIPTSHHTENPPAHYD